MHLFFFFDVVAAGVEDVCKFSSFFFFTSFLLLHRQLFCVVLCDVLSANVLQAAVAAETATLML